jgi:AcrR family transcriptional regulator
MSPSSTAQPVPLKEAPPAVQKPRVRDRIMETARELFYRHGIRAVGVESIASEAGTNKMSFYRCFKSKDDLVAEYLRGQEREAWAWWEETTAPHAGNPRAQVESLFDAQEKKTCKLDSRGCALANAAVEITEVAHPARAVVEQFKAEMRRRFRALAREMDAREPDALGDSLMLLWEGSYFTRLTFQSNKGPAQNAAKAARALMTAYSTD